MLPYRVFRKNQRVNETAVVKNQRLGHALSLVKAQQDVEQRTRVLTNGEKTGYTKRPRKLYGPDFVEKKSAPAAVEIGRAHSQIPLVRPPSLHVLLHAEPKWMLSTRGTYLLRSKGILEIGSLSRAQ